MTAFTLEMLAEASQPEWEDRIYVDPNITNSMANFIVSKITQIGSYGFIAPMYDLNLKVWKNEHPSSVSYTHLTLPTILRV